MSTLTDEIYTPEERAAFFREGITELTAALVRLDRAVWKLGAATPRAWNGKAPLSLLEWGRLFRLEKRLKKTAERLERKAKKGTK